jgi:hypothetical protein
MTYRAEGQYTGWCSRCGKPLKTQERALRVYDPAAMDFEGREPVKIMLIFCTDCREAIINEIGMGIRGAVERMEDKKKRLVEADAIAGKPT